jgi:hypothetical protein
VLAETDRRPGFDLLLLLWKCFLVIAVFRTPLQTPNTTFRYHGNSFLWAKTTSAWSLPFGFEWNVVVTFPLYDVRRHWSTFTVTSQYSQSNRKEER